MTATALITISTRASLKKYHTFNLILGTGENGDGWEFERIGTEREKLQVEKELQELRERLAQVDEWKKRREDIERDLAAVWTDKGEMLEDAEPSEEAGNTSMLATQEQGELLELRPGTA